MNYKKHVLPNGLRVIVVPMPASESVSVTLWAKVGSRFESESQAGLSHFLEHIVFKGSKKRPTAKAISEAVDSIGGEFNAGTSKESTNFYIKASKNHLETAFDVLSDMVLNPLIRFNDIEKEKGVILEEMGMYEDTPMMDIGNVFEEKIFEGNSLGRDIIGTRQTVPAIKQEDFIQFRDKYYFAQNMLITVSGGINEKEVLNLAQKYFGELRKSNSQIAQIEKFQTKQTDPQVKLKIKPIQQAHFIVGFRSHELGHPDRFKESVLATILGKGMSSRLFEEVREKRGLAYTVRTDADRYTDAAYIGTYAGVDPKNATEALKVILDEHYALLSDKLISSQELGKAKEYIKGHIALSLEDTSSVNYFFGEQELMLGKIQTPEEIYAEIDKVTIEDIQEVAKKLFKKETLNLAILGPYNDTVEFEKILK